MKYIDRYQIGMEYYMAQLSELTSPLNQFSPQDTVARLQESSFSTQNDVCKTIQAGLRRLISSRYDLGGVVPARIRVVAESQFTPTAERLLPVFKWVESLHRENERAKTQWLYALRDACSRVAPEAADFLQSFSLLRAQRVTLAFQDGSAVLSIPESLWGQARMVFDAPEFGEPPQTESVIGYLFWAEADRTDEGLEFRFLIDTEFSETVYHERLLQSGNWREFRLKCPEARMRIALFDYARRLRRSGRCGLDALTSCMTELLKKQTMLGGNALSMEENRLLGCAQLFSKTQLLTAVLPPEQTPSETLFENRYLVERTASYFGQECGELGIQLQKLLTQAQECYDNEQPERTEKLINRFCEALRQSEFDGSSRQLTRPLLKRFAEAASSYCDAPYFAVFYDRACSAVQQRTASAVAAYGFTGEFPHYYRLRRHRAEYLSFMIGDEPALTPDGALCFSCDLAVARRYATRVNGVESVYRLPAADGCAPEFAFDDRLGSHYGTVEFDAEGNALLIEWPFGEELTEEAAVRAADPVLPMLEIAEHGLRGKRLPRIFSNRHGRQLAAEHRFSHYVGRSLILGIAFAIIGLLLTQSLVQTRFQAAFAVIVCLAGAFALVVLIGAVRYLLLRRSIWRR